MYLLLNSTANYNRSTHDMAFNVPLITQFVTRCDDATYR